MKGAALYLRVSTKEQTVENQRLELERVALAKGWKIVGVYQDEGVSGARGRDKRPAYDLMLKDAVRARFDVLMAWDVSRLGRSLGGLVEVLEELHGSGVDLYLHQQALDTTTAAGRALFQMCGVFAEFERAMISERVRAGINRAKSNGTVMGRPRATVNLEALIADRTAGASIRSLSEKYSVSIGYIHKALMKNE